MEPEVLVVAVVDSAVKPVLMVEMEQVVVQQEQLVRVVLRITELLVITQLMLLPVINYREVEEQTLIMKPVEVAEEVTTAAVAAKVEVDMIQVLVVAEADIK